MSKFIPLRLLVFATSLVLLINAPAKAQSVQSVWNTTNGNWSDPTNWLSGSAPVSGNSTALIFNGSSGLTFDAVNDIGNFTLSQIQFNNSVATTTIESSPGSNTITLANSDAQLGSIIVGGSGVSITSPFVWSGETTVTNSGVNPLSFTGSSLTFGNGTKQTFINSTQGSMALADGVTYANTGTGSGVVLNFINNNSTFGSFTVGNMGGLANVTFNIGGTGTVNFVTGGNTATGDLFSNTAFLNVLSGATFDFNGNGETFGAIEGAGTIHTTVGMGFAGLGNYNFSGLITGAAGNLTVDAANTYQTISGASNNYTGNSSVLGGHLIVGANAPNGGLGVVGALGNSTLEVLVGDTSGALSSFLMIGGQDITVGRNIRIQTGNTGVSTLGGINTSGTAFYTGNITLGTNAKAAQGVTLSAAPGGTVQFTGNLLRATGATGATDTVIVTGGGTVILSGNNTYTGATTVNSGTLVLDNSTNNGNKVSSTASLTLNGGSFSYVGNGSALSSQSVNGLVLGNSANLLGGSATFTVSTGLNQNATMALGGITRNNGAVIDFSETNNGTGVADITTSTGNTSGILGGYATFNKNDWAANDGNGNVVAYSTVGSYTTTFAAGNQTSIATSTALASGGGAANSLRFTSALALTFAAGTDTLTLGSGGLLVTSNAGTTSIGTTGTRGILASSTNELIVQQQSSATTLTINSNISATTLTKSGSGTLILSGTNSMTNVIVDGGTLSITASANLGAATSAITVNGGTLAVPSGTTGTIASGSHTVIVGPAGATFNFTATVTFSGNGFSGTGPVTKTGAGIWSVGANGSTFSGAINLNQGTLSMTSSQLNSSGTMTVASGATFNINDDGTGNWFTNNGTQFLLNGTGVSGTAGAIHLTDQTQGTAFFADPTSTLLRDAVLQTDTLVVVDNGSAAFSTSTFVFGGNVSGPGALIKGGNGVLALTGRDNSYSGNTAVNSGILRVSGGNDRLPASTAVTLGSGSTGGVLQLFGNTQVIAGLTTGNSGVKDEVTNGNSASTSPSILTVNLAFGSQTYDGTLGGTAGTADNTHVNNNLSLIKDGPGSLNLSGSNTYNGLTTVVNGTLAVGNVNALGNGGSSATPDNGGTTVNSGATLDLNGTSGINEVITLNGSGVAGNGALINSNTSTAASISSGVSSISLNGSTAGWSSNASVSVGAPGSGGTSATVTLSLGLSTTGINLTGGSGYGTTTLPAVTVTGGGGTGAVLFAGLGLTTNSYTVTPSTQTYSVAPTVAISGQGSNGIAATATAVLDAQGHVIGITLTNPGTGFIGTPTITFTGGTVLVAGALPSATGVANQFTVTSINIVNPGSGFTGVPTITIGGTGTGASATYVDGNFLLNGITITSNGSGYTSAPAVTITGSSSTATANLSSVNLATDSSIGGVGDLTINSVVSGSGAFNKVGFPTTTLTATNTYTGATNVTAGNLQVGLSGVGTTGTGAVTVNGPGAVLSGTGTVTAPTNIILGTIKPGDNGGAGTGTLTLQSLTFSPTSPSTVAVLQITGSTANSNLRADKIVVTGDLALNANSNFLIDGTGYTAAVGDTFDLLNWAGLVTANGFNIGTNLRTGANSANNEGNLDLPDITGTGLWNISMSGNDLIASIVSPAPEPGRATLLAMGGCLFLMRRRRSV